MRPIRAWWSWLAAVACAASFRASPVVAHEGHDHGPHPAVGAAAGASRSGAASETAGAPNARTSPAGDATQAQQGPRPVVFRVRPDAHADLGWTGIAHGQEWPAEQRLGFALECSAGEPRCRALGGKRGDFFGAPIPLSSGGVPACIVNRLRSGVGGTVDPTTGCGDLQISLSSSVFLGEEIGRPCPVCVGDPTANDGRKDGRCTGGAADGAPCDGAGVSRLFGITSNDCQPSSRKAAGELAIDLTPLTTGDASLSSNLTCKTGGGKSAPRCACAAQVQAYACIGSGCDGSGRCDDGPIDGVCSAKPYRGCRPGSGRTDCDAVEPGSGECKDGPRPCFPPDVSLRGRCDPSSPTYVAVFCTPQTAATALNSVAGLPGPARLVLPLEKVE